MIKKIINQTIKIRTTTHLAIAVLISLICFLSATLIEYQLKDKDRDNQICNECSTKPEEVNKYLAIIDSIDLEKRKDKTVKQEEINEYDALIEREAKNIDNAVNVSKKSVYSYLEYLADNIHEVSSSFLILALGVYILLTLLKVYSQERSKGWKRLGV